MVNKETMGRKPAFDFGVTSWESRQPSQAVRELTGDPRKFISGPPTVSISRPHLNRYVSLYPRDVEQKKPV